jgi:Putative Ig domain
VTVGPPPPLTLTCPPDLTATVGVFFDSGPAMVSGGVPPYTFSIVGTLPPGLTLNTSTGEVTGTPTAAGSFSIEVTDAAGHVAGSGGIPGLDLGTVASYIFVDTGSTHLGWNAYQLNGNVLFGLGLTVQLSGGTMGAWAPVIRCTQTPRPTLAEACKIQLRL